MRLRFFSIPLLLLLALIFVFSSELFGQEQASSSSFAPLSIHSQGLVLDVQDKRLHLQQLLDSRSDLRWQKLEEHIPNLGYSQSQHWIKLEIANPVAAQPTDAILELATPSVDEVVLYVVRNGSLVDKIATGDDLPFSQRPIAYRNFAFPLHFEPNESLQLFLKLSSSYDFLAPIRLWSPHDWQAHMTYEYIGYGIFFGLISVMLLYAGILYASTREAGYLYNIFFVASITLATVAISGFGFQFLYPNNVWLEQRLLPLALSMSALTGHVFSRYYLNTPIDAPKCDRAIRVLIVLAILTLLLTPFIAVLYAVLMAKIVALFSLFLLTVVAIVNIKRKQWTARYYLIFISVLFVGIMIQVLMTYGLIPYHDVLNLSPELAIALQLFLIPAALGLRLRYLTTEHEKAQRVAIASLEVTSKLKDEFLANISHELRTPLHGVIGLSESLLAEPSSTLTQAQVRVLQMITQTGNHLSHLVNQILDFSKLRHNRIEVHLQPLDLYSAVGLSVSVCSAIPKHKNIQIRNLVPPDLKPVMADEDRLQQVLYNLIGNSIKFTSAGEIKISAMQVGQEIECRISDTGIGIPASQWSNLFEPFEQGDGSITRRFGGTGLGLAISKQLIEVMQGSIQVESKEGQGTEVRFTLPQAALVQTGKEAPSFTYAVPPALIGLPDEPSADVSDADVRTTDMATILVVDDDPVNLTLLESQLHNSGYRVKAAIDGQSALQLISASPPDLVLLDLMMPDISGIDICRILREEFSKSALPIIMLTARTQENVMIDAFQAGVNDYITKPSSYRELMARVSAQLDVKQIAAARQENQLLKEEIQRREQAEGALVASQTRLSQLLDLQDRAILAVDTDLRINYFNKGAELLFGYGRAEADDLPLTALITAASITQMGLQEHPGLNPPQECHAEAINCVLRDGSECSRPACAIPIVRGGEVSFAIVILESGEKPPTDATQVELKDATRKLCNTVIRHTLEAWEACTGKSKIELAEQSKLWPVYIDKSTPTTRTLDKYLRLETLPQNPRYTRVIRTAEFALDRCRGSASSPQQIALLVAELAELRNRV